MREPDRAMTPEDFYRAHRAEAVRIAIALTGRIEAGEDLAHDALIRVGARLGEIENPGAYLRTTIVNACRSWHRSTSRESRRLQLDADRAPRTTELDASTGETLRALANLTYRQRAAIVLRYWGGWGDDEIATSLGCRRATVRTSIHRGLAALREELSE